MQYECPYLSLRYNIYKSHFYQHYSKAFHLTCRLNRQIVNQTHNYCIVSAKQQRKLQKKKEKKSLYFFKFSLFDWWYPPLSCTSRTLLAHSVTDCMPHQISNIIKWYQCGGNDNSRMSRAHLMFIASADICMYVCGWGGVVALITVGCATDTYVHMYTSSYCTSNIRHKLTIINTHTFYFFSNIKCESDIIIFFCVS